VKKDNPKDSVPTKEPELEFYLVPVHESDSNVVVIADTIGERTTNSYWIQGGEAKLSLKQYDYTTEIKYKDLNVAFSNANKTMAEPEVSERNGRKRYTTKCTFAMEDGNVGYINAEAFQLIEKVNGQDHTWSYAKLNSFEVSITRFDAAEVAAEVEHAREIEKQMAKEAREKMRAERTEEFRETVSKKSEELKNWFSHFGKKE
jgi:hypothetical protein